MQIRKQIEVSSPPGEAFSYVAEFSNTPDWDPGIAEAKKLTEGPPRQGSEFDIVALFRGKRQPFHYVVTEFEQDRRIVLSGEGEKAHSIDTITFEPSGAGTRITYMVDFRLKGFLRPVGPFLTPVMSRMGDDALQGLKGVLDRPS